MALAATTLQGCATLMSGSSQDVTFNSVPEGAEVSLPGRILGKTPITIRLDKRAGQSVSFSKEGYKPVTMSLETQMNSWFWGNIVLGGGFFGSTTDGLSGAVTEYSPSQYMVTLAPTASTALDQRPMQPPSQQAKEFIVMSYREIMKDLASGQGPYLASLLDLLKVDAVHRPEAVRKIKALAEVYSNISEFADRVTDLYAAAPARSPI